MSVFTVNVLPTLIDTLKTGTDDAKDDALGQLAQIMDTSYGEDAEALCEYLRVSGAVALLAEALDNAEPAIYQTSMLLIGNIASVPISISSFVSMTHSVHFIIN